MDLPLIETERLIIVPTPAAIVARRLVEAGFDDEVTVRGETRSVRFGCEWPADAMVLFERGLSPGSIAIERDSGQAVAQAGVKGEPAPDRSYEIGYGVMPSWQRRGYATEIVMAIVACAFVENRPAVTAMTAPDNIASQRVLEKAGFRRGRIVVDPADGDVITWRCERSPSGG